MSLLPLGNRVSVIAHHPCGLWALNKPGGVRSHPNGNTADPKALLTVPYNRRAESYAGPASGLCWHLLNRLDAPTSGVILLADDPELAELVKELFATRAVEKTYAALVRGKPRKRGETWRDRLQVRRGAGGARAATGGNEEAVTEMRLLQTASEPPLRSLLELSPKTGRTHQLRVQCADRRMPIIGDATYGDFRFNREFARAVGDKRLFLHASELRLSFDWRGRRIHFAAKAELPAAFRQALAG